MKLLKFFVLLSAACFMGCSTETGETGDANDPAAAGSTDDEQMDDETGDVAE